MNSDCETARRFALSLFPAGYAERWAAKLRTQDQEDEHSQRVGRS
jgi:hypothetical protein